MKHIYILLLSCLFISCLSSKSVFDNIPFSESELNVKCIMTFLQHEHTASVDKNHIGVYRNLEFFDDCVTKEYGSRYGKKGSIIDSLKVLGLSTGNLYVPENDAIFFTNTLSKYCDYRFSPALYNPETKHISMQAMKITGERYRVAFQLLGSEIYLSYSLLYDVTTCSIPNEPHLGQKMW